MKFRILLLFLFLANIANGQSYTRMLVDSLASESFAGRGYVDEGAIRASEFIASQMDSLGLKPFDMGFKQQFEMRVNSFPGKVELIIDGDSLKLGDDYILASNSGNGKATDRDILKVNIYKPKELEKLTEKMLELKDKVILIEKPDTLTSASANYFYQTVYLIAEYWPVILSGEEKLTASIARDQLAHPLFITKERSFSKRSKVSYHVEAKLNSSIQSNVLGYIPSKSNSYEYIIVSAHYDHLGKMGSELYFPGANDNASGVAQMLSLAAEMMQDSLDHNLLFVAFAGEEAGLVGSNYFVEHSPVPINMMSFVLNLDISGTGDEGITVVNGKEFTKEYDLLNVCNDELELIPEIKARGASANSDHYPFYAKGVKSFFIYTRGGIKAYHDIYDRPETLPLTKTDDLVKLYREFLLRLDKAD